VKRFLGIVLISSVFLTLCGLSAWQFQRREWKSQLLETLAINSTKPTLSLGDLLSLPKEQQWYRPVTLEGHLLWDKSLRVGLRQQDGQAGYWIVTPMQLTEGYALIATGFLPMSASGSWVPPAIGAKTLTAKALPLASPTWFTPKNKPEHGIWHTLSSSEMARFLQLKPVLPLVFVAGTKTAAGLSAVEATPALRNDHLQYALTWASLAFALIIFIFFYNRRS
jgi:surfeit locus 1 family protein